MAMAPEEDDDMFESPEMEQLEIPEVVIDSRLFADELVIDDVITLLEPRFDPVDPDRTWKIKSQVATQLQASM